MRRGPRQATSGAPPTLVPLRVRILRQWFWGVVVACAATLGLYESGAGPWDGGSDPGTTVPEVEVLGVQLERPAPTTETMTTTEPIASSETTTSTSTTASSATTAPPTTRRATTTTVPSTTVEPTTTTGATTTTTEAPVTTTSTTTTTTIVVAEPPAGAG